MEAQLRRLGPNPRIKVLKTPKECRTKIWLAGRGTSCQIYTKSKYASRQHFSITYRDQKYFISDLQSANGTFLNDEKVVSETALNFGSIISVGVPSEMRDSPDCVVYIFEPNSDGIHREKQPSPTKTVETVAEVNNSEPAPPLPAESVVHMEIDPQPKESEKGRTDSADVEKTVLNESSSSDVVIIEETDPREKHAMEISEPQATKKRKLERKTVEIIVKQEESPEKAEKEEEGKGVGEEEGDVRKERVTEDDEDMFAYEALTQVDEPQVKDEPDFLNYSQTEELIEISDSEEDWLKQEGGNRSPDGGDEDDDIVILEAIIKEPRKVEPPPVRCKVEDDLTETDRKWMGRLLKMEPEHSPARNAEVMENQPEVMENQPEVMATSEMVAEEGVEEPVRGNESNVVPCTAELSRLSVREEQREAAEPPDAFPRVEVPQKIVRRAVAKKCVSFNMVPQIKYFEVPTRTRLTASEIGRMRFTRIIYNICSWNTHWLEECKRVAPDKNPPDICEERLRKIPKKFPSHAEYMKALIPAMLLHLWNKIKDKWVASGESGFRQTVSCDSCEDYHAENLSVYKCTGLVQSVDAHKQLLREGHLVLLRLHQVQLPQFATPASEKYSKKLGYLVFGFVEAKTYERFHNQKLHPALAERCGSVVGDLHIVRLRILVKKRPSFQIDKQKLVQLTVVRQITQEIRLFRGICFLPDSPLCADILKPPRVEAPVEEPPKLDLVFKGPLDECQSHVVRKLSHACSSSSSFLHSVMGAAGTGKGQVVLALVLQLLYGEEWKGKRPKIVYCTPWSIPLDEMVVRLRGCRQAADEPFSLVRVGPVREVKPEVRDLCLSNLANGRRNANQRDLDLWKMDAEIDVIREADVICTTCISAGVSKMTSAFDKLLIRDRDRKVICIIDEAMSCREPESVIPLLLGVTHLILVGDIYQLEPTFSGEKTSSLGLDMSLFSRIHKNFFNVPDRESWPISILKTQYRMCSGLSKFTGHSIYCTRLQKPTAVVSNRIGNLRSHLLVVDQQGQQEKTPFGKDSREIRIVSQMTRAVLRLAKAAGRTSVRIGVITCDARQTESLQALLPKGKFPEVEVEKIQAFQGREVNLVVFLYDGRKILVSWLATALTRAKNGLFIFATEQSLKGNPWFTKMAEGAEKYGFLKHAHPDMSAKEFEEIVCAV